jgi:hypothetical protein
VSIIELMFIESRTIKGIYSIVVERGLKILEGMLSLEDRDIITERQRKIHE